MKTRASRTRQSKHAERPFFDGAPTAKLVRSSRKLQPPSDLLLQGKPMYPIALIGRLDVPLQSLAPATGTTLEKWSYGMRVGIAQEEDRQPEYAMRREGMVS